MNPSDSFGIAAQCGIEAPLASVEMTFGSVASWKMTMSGSQLRMTASSASSRPAPPWRML